MNDCELLHEYARNHADEIFAGFVNRYIGMVYASALRQVGEAQMAEDVTQAVFIILARKAGSLPSGTLLSGWLFRTTRFVAARAKRGEQRRRSYERKAAEMNSNDETPAETWGELAPLLDGAIAQLNKEDQSAVLLRYFQGKPFNEIGKVMGSSEEAARKRVDRSIVKLRAVFQKHGYAVTAAALAAALSSHAVESAPEFLPAKISSAASSPQIDPRLSQLAKAPSESFSQVSVGLGVAAGIVLILGLFFATGNSSPSPTQTSTPASRQTEPSLARASNFQAPLAVAQPQPSPESGIMVKVVDRSDQRALPGVGILVRAGEERIELETDANGSSLVPSPTQRSTGLTLWVSVAGYVPITVEWSRNEMEGLPDTYTVQLDRGGLVAGVVRDPNGDPINGAKLQIVGLHRSRAEREGIAYHPTRNAIFSQPDGTWSSDMISTRFQDAALMVTHPGFVATVTNISLTWPSSAKHVITLGHGFTLAGRVLTKEGLPIAGAAIQQTHNRISPKASATADTDGKYEMLHLDAGSLRVRVQAKGFAAIVETVEIKAGMPEKNFTLESSPILFGRVVDETGQPVPEALIGTRTDLMGNDELGWQATTDSKGYFMWDSAPRGRAEYNVVKEGYSLDNRFQLLADGTEHILKIQKLLHVQISGTVVDAVTSLPVPKFRVLRQGIHILNPLIADPELTLLGEGKSGTFNFSMPQDRPYEAFAIQVQAEGWIPENSTPKRLADGNQKFEIKLRKGGPLSGVVVGLTGEPVERAQVVVRESGLHVSLHEPGKLSLDPNDPHLAVTDATGRFSFKTPFAAADIIVIHDRGFAVVPLADGTAHPIALQPWGRIEGASNRPGDRVMVHALQNSPLPSIDFSYHTVADSTGHFTFEKIPAGNVVVSRRTILRSSGPSPVGLSHKMFVEMKPGETARVQIGGAGRTIVGRLIAENRTDVDWTRDLQRLKAVSAMSDPGARLLEETAFFPVFKPDGSFTIEDVTPGSYLFVVQITEPNDESQIPFMGKPIGSGKFEVTIPDGAGAPVDLGVFKVSTRK